MKKVLIIGLFALFLVGCGCSKDKSYTLKCNLENGDHKRNLTVIFKNDNKEVDDAIMEFSYMPENIENAKKIIREDCDKKGFKKCDLSVEENVLTYVVGGNPEALGIAPKNSFDEIKKILENDGYTCKY